MGLTRVVSQRPGLVRSVTYKHTADDGVGREYVPTRIVHRNEESSEEGEQEEVVTTRAGRRILKPSRFLAATKISKDEWKLEEMDEAIKAELQMLFVDLLALRAVKRAAIKGGTKILRSYMFIVAKYLASGTFDKMKA